MAKLVIAFNSIPHDDVADGEMLSRLSYILSSSQTPPRFFRLDTTVGIVNGQAKRRTVVTIGRPRISLQLAESYIAKVQEAVVFMDVKFDVYFA